jgi:polyphosphate kinase
MYISSVDWKMRNLYRRIEVAFPVYDQAIKNQIRQSIDLQLQALSVYQYVFAGNKLRFYRRVNLYQISIHTTSTTSVTEQIDQRKNS